MKTILLKFAGPLQSWGTSSHFETRHTDPHPSKSAVIGLVAAAMGFRRNETEKIRDLNRLHFAVRVDQPGHITEDYQTAHIYKYNPDPEVEKTYVTHRYYLEDEVFLVAIGHEEDKLVDEIADALRHPYFQLYMGRRSCPVPEDFIIDVVEQDVVAALKQAPMQSSDWYRKHFSGRVFIYADSQMLPGENASRRKDEIASLSWDDRGYKWREEAQTYISVTGIQEEHDAFGSLGG